MSKFIKFILIPFAAFSFTLFASSNYANPSGNPGKGHGKAFQSHGNGKGHSQANVMGKSAKTQVKQGARFSSQDKTQIIKYFDAKPMGITTLPPGIAKNLARGKPLPPGIAKVFLPSDLVSTLPVYPGYEYLAVGHDAVLVNQSTGMVADILSNIVK